MSWTGQLNSDEIYPLMYNMLISLQMFTKHLDLNDKILNEARQSSTMYGDTKLYHATNSLYTTEWKNDDESTNLLQTHRARDPQTQAIVLDRTRIIALTIDYYMSKRAFLDEGSFSDFTSQLISWINDTKQAYDHSYYLTYLGTTETELNNQIITLNNISINEPTSLEEKENEAKELAFRISEITRELGDLTRKYTDFGNLRSFAKDKIKIIWNDYYLDRIKLLDLPTIYHDSELLKIFSEYSVPKKYFGKLNTSATTGDGSTIRLMEEKMFNNDINKDYFGGELVPNGLSVGANESYTEDKSIICKILVDFPPLLTSFNVDTSFINSRSLTENKYLIWGFNTLQYLQDYPFITVKAGKISE